MKKRILILNHNVREKGTFFRAWKTAEQFRDRGWAVTFVTTGHGWYRPRHSWCDGIEVWDTPSWSPFFEADAGWSPLGLVTRLFIALRRKYDATVSFSHHPVDQYPARLARLIWGTFWICDWCDLWAEDGIWATMREKFEPNPNAKQSVRQLLEKWDNALEFKAAKSCDFMTVISSYLGRRTHVLGKSKRRIARFVSGADTEAIGLLNRQECRHEIGLEQEAVTIGYMANVHPDELLLADALKIVFAKRPSVHMFTIGPDFFGGEEMLEERGIKHRIDRLGRVPFSDVPKYLAAADLMLVPLSDSTFNKSRWPNKIGDHLAAGRAQVACAVGDVGPFLKKYRVGLSCEPTPESFAEAIINLIDDHEMRREMENEARRVAETSFSWDMRFEKLFRRLGAVSARFKDST